MAGGGEGGPGEAPSRDLRRGGGWGGGGGSRKKSSTGAVVREASETVRWDGPMAAWGAEPSRSGAPDTRGKVDKGKWILYLEK